MKILNRMRFFGILSIVIGMLLFTSSVRADQPKEHHHFHLRGYCGNYISNPSSIFEHIKSKLNNISIFKTKCSEDNCGDSCNCSEDNCDGPCKSPITKNVKIISCYALKLNSES